MSPLVVTGTLLLPEATAIKNPIVFVDVETTGLEPTSALLELGMIITDGDLSPRASFSVVVGSPVHLQSVSPEVVAMHSRNGLWADVVRKGISYSEAERRARRFLAEFGVKGAPMAGSSVHFDRRMLRSHMPTLEGEFHYRNIDVSTIKELVRRWAPEHLWKGARGVHRAIDDLYDTLAELHHYRTVMGL